MRALDWKRYLDAQAEQHGKRVFTLAELSHISGRSGAALNVELTRLRKSKLLERIARGIYAAPGRVTLMDVLPWLDDRAYVTGAYVLQAHGFITQIPSEITCFTDRRHFRSVRDTGVGRLRFVVVKPPVYAMPRKGCVAPPAQALCDLGWMADRSGTDLRSLYTFRGLERLRRDLGSRCSVAPHPVPVDPVALLADLHAKGRELVREGAESYMAEVQAGRSRWRDE